MSFIINIRAKSITHIEEFLIICYYQVNKYDYSNLSNINYTNEDIILL